MAEEVGVKSTLSTRNVTLVTYQLDEVQSSDERQAEVLTAIIQRLGVSPKPKYFSNYNQINSALNDGVITEGQFVLFRVNPETLSVVVAKYRTV